MRKIGIVTIHRINNYGAVMQAYALNAYLRACGHDAKTIDYRTYRVKESRQLFSPMKSIMDIPRNAQALLYAGRHFKRNRRFDAFLNDYLPITPEAYYTNEEMHHADLDFDTYICGSDQIWNTFCRNYDNTFLLDFARNRGQRISYAASLGAKSVHENHEPAFRRELPEYRALSVREADAVEIIEPYAGKRVSHVCDPVFLLTKSQWEETAAEPLLKEPYIFFYHVKGDLPGMRDYVRQLSKQMGMKVVVVNMNLREMLYQNVKRYDAGPREFLSLIQNAAFVCTNSFHATAFSLIFRKNFMVFSPGANGGSSRIYSLLQQVDLTDRIYGNHAPIEKEIDFDRVWSRLTPFINDSKAFLRNALEET